MQKLGKEIKIGLAVIGVLVAAFGYILFRQMTRPTDLTAAPSANTAANAAATKAGSPDKPTVVAATDTRPAADTATDGPNSSRSLFSSGRHAQPGDSSDSGGYSGSAYSGTGPSGSFFPSANNHAAKDNGTATNTAANVAAANGSAAGSPAGGGPSAATNNTPSPDSQNARAGDGSHSLFTAGNNTPPAEITAPATANGSAAVPADPFQQRSAPPTNALADTASPHGAVASATGPQPAGLMPADPVPPQSSGSTDLRDDNPLRHPQDAAARTTSATSPEAPPSDVAHSAFGANTAPPNVMPVAASTVPPSITSNPINIPSTQAAPSDPVAPPQSLSAQPAAADAQPHRPGQYTVQPNDNYWTVSEKVYGTGGYFKAIYEHNRRLHAQSDRLQVGDVLDVPDQAVLEHSYPELCPKSARSTGTVAATPPSNVGSSVAAPADASPPPGTRIYSVADGDTLYEIARRELGKASRWGEIYQLNHDQLGNDFGYLRPGTQLVIPADGAAAAMAREPNGALQR